MSIDKKMLDAWEIKLRPAITATFPAEDAQSLIHMAKESLELQPKLAIATEALKFYGSPDVSPKVTKICHGCKSITIIDCGDSGKTAKEALKKIEGKR